MPDSQRRSSNRRRRRRKRYKGHKPPQPLSNCPICEQPVRDVLTAIAVSSDGTPAHFDCVLKKLSKDEELRNREKICYIGGGSFGIVKFDNPQDTRRFTIRKRIQFEEKETSIFWRNEVSDKVNSP